MEYNEEMYNHCGSVPEFGAIFMSNSSTKEECLERRLLGLPSGFFHFVKHVKEGMLLFLFEYEKRELHGVFRATSDGAMNIVPNAYISSGKRFPAQVKFVQIWHCLPLSEDEFRDAILENYFSAKKFRFGVSETQVRRLLCLFGSRKLRTKTLQGHSTKSNVEMVDDEENNLEMVDTRNHGNNQIAIDDNRLGSANVAREYNGFGEFALHTSTEHSREQLDEARGLDDDSQFLRSSFLRDKHDRDSECEPAFSHSSARDERDNDCVSFGNKLIEGSFLEPDTLGQYIHLNQSSPVDYASQAVLEPSSLNNELYQESSAVHHTVEPHNFNLSFPRSYRDAWPMPNFVSSHQSKGLASPLHYDPDSPGIFKTSSVGLCNPMPTYHCNSIFPSDKVQHFPSILEPNVTSTLSHNVSNLHPVGSVYPQNVLMSPSTKDSRGFFLSPTPVPTFLPLDVENNRISEETNFSCLVGPDNSPSLVFDSRSSSVLEQENGVKMGDTNESAACVGKENIGHSESMANIADFYEYSRLLYSDSENKRPSVFSRLALPPRQDNDVHRVNDESDVESSVDELMNLLHQSHYQWTRRKNVKPAIRKHDNDNVAASKKREHTTLNSMSLNFQSVNISEGTNTIVIPTFEESDVERAEGIRFVDFKRRRKLQLNQENASVDSDGSTRVQQKRRKLIRPKLDDILSTDGVMIDTMKNESKISQDADASLGRLPVHYDNQNKAPLETNREGEKKMNNSVVSCHDVDETNRASLPVDTYNMSLSAADQNHGKEGFNFEHHALEQHCDSSRSSVQQDMGIEKTETKPACSGHGHERERNFGENTEIRNQSFLIDDEVIGCGKPTEYPTSKKASKEAEDYNNTIEHSSLESKTRKCNAPVFKVPEIPQEACKSNEGSLENEACLEAVVEAELKDGKTNFYLNDGCGNCIPLRQSLPLSQGPVDVVPRD